MHCLKIETNAMWAFLLMIVTTSCHMDHVKNNWIRADCRHVTIRTCSSLEGKNLATCPPPPV